ncbi:MAG: hypothetical protein EOM08_12555, partial [Clostridia bacterium]|nr:hypothetical protein [Clostridia bacterium]
MVNEAGLPTGSSPSSDSEIDANGVITVSGGIGPYIYALTGSATGTYGSLALDADGAYTYTLNTRYDTTPDANNGTQIESARDSFDYLVTDANGNTTTGTIYVGIMDDVPTAHADTASVVEGGSVTGDVLTNDVFGADGATIGGGVVGARSGGDATTAVTMGVGAAITGLYGVLTLDADGGYSYAATPNQTLPAGAQDAFTYTIKDGDGDLSTTTLTINVSDVSVSPANTSGMVYESGLSGGGPVPADGTQSAGDGEKIIGGALNLQAGWTAEAATGTTSFGTWSVTAAGKFSYTLTDNTTDVPGVDETDSFSYTAVDADGNRVTNTVTITIVDDAPIVSPDTDIVSSGGITTGNVITDASAGDAGDSDSGADQSGADGWTGVVGVVAGSTVVNTENNNVGVQVDGLYGKLTLNADGSYSYQANTVFSNVVDTFVYTVKDSDGDLASTTLTIDVSGSPVPVDGTPTAIITHTDHSLNVDEYLNNGVVNVLNSEFMAYALVNDYGANGAGSTKFVLSVLDGEDSGLITADGNIFIFLYENNGLIEGRFDDGAGTSGVAFTLEVGIENLSVPGHVLPFNGAKLTLTQRVALKHPWDDDPDEQVTIGAGKISLVLNVMDSDGDVASSSLDLGNRLLFWDDAPANYSISTNIDNVNGGYSRGAFDFESVAGADGCKAVFVDVNGSTLVGATTSNGAITLNWYSSTPHILTGTDANGDDVFKAILHADSGSYEVYLYDDITVVGNVLEFATTIIDGDGDTATGTLSVTLGTGFPVTPGTSGADRL